MNSSNASLHCRLEWRPSRWRAFALLTLGALSMVSLWLSALPWWGVLIAGVLLLAYMFIVIRTDARRAPVQLAWAGGAAPVMLIRGNQAEEHMFVDLHARGGLVVLTLKDCDGRKQRWVWWPDTLDAAGRRALRLEASIGAEAAPTRTTSLNPVA
ncbi:MAG: hypothetical protein ABIQ97_07185 [Lysobacteraceae bacterium]